MPLKHTMPPFLEGTISPEKYEAWLSRKARAHVNRDRDRGMTASVSQYKEAIHAAVFASEGRDAYTSEQLNWSLIGTYDNEQSRTGRHSYKATLALLPTVDHIDTGATEASFKICGWAVNDAKHDLTIETFRELCKRVLTHAGYEVRKRNQ